MGKSAELIEWSFACPDWEARLRAGASLLPDLPLDMDAANKAVAIFNNLRLPDVPDQPPLATAGGEWQRDIARAIFGSIDESGWRRVAEAFVLVPKKNAKTTGGAAIMVTALLMNRRPRAEFVLVGPTQEIADIAFQQASGMIEADPEGFLQKRFHVAEHTKTITDRLNKAKLKIKTFDMKVATGVKPAGILIDEIHLLSSISGASRVIGQLRGGMISNPEAFLIMITTQSDQPPAGVFKTELDYARGVRDGRISQDVKLLPMLYEFPEAMQIDREKPWQDTRNWHMVLPNLGRSITLAPLAAEYRAACDKGVEEERRWASQHLNIQIGLALHTDRWRGTDFWERQVDRSLTWAELKRRSEVVVVGIDGGGLDDLLGFCAIGRCSETGDWLALVRAWAHPTVFELRKDIVERLEDFERQKDLVRCEQPTQDLIEVADLIMDLWRAGLLPKKLGIGLDPAGIKKLRQEIASRFPVGSEIPDELMVAIPQGYRMSPMIWGAERKLYDGTLWHADQPLFDWCVGNAKVEQRGSAVSITKETAGKAKIDPLVGMFNAFELMSLNPEAAGRSVYEERGIRVL
jgi:phage terminase large subunit-like protein